uniref:Uncharacterized protein n=1 Tax=Rhizophora mucronata TaxID=61149 RepID=A0A2P2N518_RHIMU
MLPLCNNLKYR